MRQETGFKGINYAEREAYEERKKRLSSEKDLTGENIKELLRKHFKNRKFLTIEERNHVSRNDNPFDFVIGEEETLSMVGIEIKGDTDTFNRLKSQLQAYSFVFEEIYLLLHKKKVPDWLPEYVGILRVFDNGEIFQEKHSIIRDWLDVGSLYEWDALFLCNGLGKSSKETQRVLNIVRDVRNNILFNRFFAVQDGFNTKKFSRWYPLSDEEKAVLIGFDVPTHYKSLDKDIIQLQKRFDNLKKAVDFGIKHSQTKL